MENIEQPNKGKKIIKIILLVVLIILILGGGASAYYYYDKSNKAKTEMETAKEAAESAKRELEKIEKSISDKESGASGTMSADTSEDCPFPLTDAEEEIVADWDTYTSATYSYSIKHPSTWTVSEEIPESVTLTTAGDEEDTASMQIRTDTATAIGFVSQTTESTDTAWVDCLEATVIRFISDGTGRLIVTNTIDSGENFLFMFSYEYGGASMAADMVELNDLIIKTVDFE